MECIEQLLEGVHNSRVLVIDDSEFVARHVAERLRKTYKEVDFQADPEKAIDMIIDSLSHDNPYQALVLDLDMPKVNGIQLLKTLTSKNITIPTVIFSGEQGDPIAVEYLHRMSKVQRESELSGILDDVEKQTKGLPITYMRKFESENTILELVNSLDIVMLIGQRRQADLSGFLDQFSIPSTQYHSDNPHITQMADIVKLTKQRFVELREELQPLRRHLRKKAGDRIFNDLQEMINHLSQVNYTHRGLSDPEFGRSNTHMLQEYYAPGFVHSVGGCAIPETSHIKPSSLTSQRQEKLEQIGEKFIREHLLLADAFNHHRIMSKDYSRVEQSRLIQDISILLKDELPKYRNLEGIKITSIYSAKDIHVKYPRELFRHIFMNPIVNAVDALKDSPEKDIYVEVRRKRVSRLPKAQKEYFTSTGYQPSDQVVQILIRDTGCGISKENLARITEEGFTTKESHAGFGLAFVDEMMKKLPGSYRIKSKVGEGTDFYLYVPITVGSPNQDMPIYIS